MDDPRKVDSTLIMRESGMFSDTTDEISQVRANCPFLVWRVDRETGEQQAIMGPDSNEDRVFTVLTPHGSALYVELQYENGVCTIERTMAAPRAETPDPTPVEMPIGVQRPESLEEMMNRLIVDRWLHVQRANSENETFEEANDFEVDEDPEPFSQYEVVELQEEEPIQAEPVPESDGQAAQDEPATPEPEPEPVQAKT